MIFENIITNQELDISKLDTGYYIIKIYDGINVENKKLISKIINPTNHLPGSGGVEEA